MQLLKQNMKNIYGKQGETWIADLPTIVAQLADHWHLMHIHPVDNMTFHYVARAVTQNDEPVMLKIGCDKKTIAAEKNALLYFDGNGCVRLIDHHDKCNALLLEQAIPGVSLKLLYEAQPQYVMDNYIAVMNKLHKSLAGNHAYRHTKDWLKAIDKLQMGGDCPVHLVKKAISLRESLLSSMTAEIFLHGDLHHDNILKNGETWVAIDPQGIIGEPAFEAAAFDFMYVKELANNNLVKQVMEARIHQLAQKANLDAQRIKDWVFVRLILMVAWQVEDKGDASWAIKLAHALT